MPGALLVSGNPHNTVWCRRQAQLRWLEHPRSTHPHSCYRNCLEDSSPLVNACKHGLLGVGMKTCRQDCCAVDLP